MMAKNLKIKALGIEELWEGEMKRMQIANHSVLFFKGQGEIYAYEDRCPHLKVPLSEGILSFSDDGLPILQCSAHLWQFNALTGQGINPQKSCLKKFPTTIEQGSIWLIIENEVNNER